MSKFTPEKSPTKSGGVKWWQQCARSFITPYGKATVAPEPWQVFKRIQPFTCEWLTRPDVALSEYCETMISNIPILQNHGKGVLKKSFVADFTSHFQHIMGNMQALNKKNTDTDTAATATATDAKEVLKSMLENDKLDEKMEQIFLLSGAMFAMSSNYLIGTSLLRHPEEYGKRVSGQSNVAAAFRQQPNVQSMKSFVLDPFKPDTAEGLSRKASRALTKAFLESSDEAQDDEALQPSTSHKKRVSSGKQKQQYKSTRKASTPAPSQQKTTSPSQKQSKPLKLSKRRASIAQLAQELEEEVKRPKRKANKK